MVRLSEEAYQRLRRAKRPRESFTDVVLRVTLPARRPLEGLMHLGRTAKEIDDHVAALKRIDELDRPKV